MITRRTSADASNLAGKLQCKFDRSCDMGNSLCMNMLRKHNATQEQFTNVNITTAEKECSNNTTKEINIGAKCENQTSNINKKNHIKRPPTPYKNGINLPLSCSSKNCFPVPPVKSNVLNRDKVCNMNFNLQKDERSPILHQRYGRRIIRTQSTNNLSTNVDEVSVFNPKRQSLVLPTYPLNHLPDLRKTFVKRHSFPPTKATGSFSNITERINENDSYLPDVSIDTFKYKQNGIKNLTNCRYSDDYMGQSDDEDDILSDTQGQSVTQKVYRYLQSIENVESYTQYNSKQ